MPAGDIIAHGVLPYAPRFTRHPFGFGSFDQTPTDNLTVRGVERLAGRGEGVRADPYSSAVSSASISSSIRKPKLFSDKLQ